jgi:uncharacterized UBP type Zn finger protein
MDRQPAADTATKNGGTAGTAVEKFAPAFVPGPFPLRNPGNGCFLNALLQGLVSCTAFTRAVLANKEYLQLTKTGAAMFNFVSAYATPEAAKPAQQISLDIEWHSTAIVAALIRDLQQRRPRVRFGLSQESASEALVHLLDMMEPAEKNAGSASESPITRLFQYRCVCTVYCGGCRQIVSRENDYGVVVNTFYLRDMKKRPQTVEEFSDALVAHNSVLTDYVCDHCSAEAEPQEQGADGHPTAPQHPVISFRRYRLSMVPEIIACLFEIYGVHGGRTQYFIPAKLEIPRIGGGVHVYSQVAQILHSGTLNSGHYITHALRNPRIYLFNDAATPRESNAFVQSPNTYIALYHYYCEAEDLKPAKAKPAPERPAPEQPEPSATAGASKNRGEERGPGH